MTPLRLTVQDAGGAVGPRPVSGGVPLAAGAAPEGTVFTLTTAQGEAVALQSRVLARWQDGSARWVLLDFVADLPPYGRGEFFLSTGAGGAAAGESVPMAVAGAEPARWRGPVVSAWPAGRDAVTAGPRQPDPGCVAPLVTVGGSLSVGLVLTLGTGAVCRAVPATVDVECDGPLRRTFWVRGDFRLADGSRVFQFRLRCSAFAGSSRVRLEPMVVVDADHGILQAVRSLYLTIHAKASEAAWRLGGDPGWAGEPGRSGRLFQRDDATCEFNGALGQTAKAPGWVELQAGDVHYAAAVRDFWQQWPKSIEVAAGSLAVGLLPSFQEGAFDHMEPWYKHRYLFSGNCYQLRTGQARRWDVWVDMAGGGAGLSALANAPSVPAADPAQAIATGVWDAIVPAGDPAMVAYDPWVENLYEAYVASIRHERDYGAMNWGDWFGERKVNWGNHEYDTVNQLLIQYARTGDPKYYLSADVAARHSAEVDVVHAVNPDLAQHFTTNWPVKGYPPRPGMVHEHSVGHVGSFYPIETIRKLFVAHRIGDSDRPYLCLDPFNLGHVWTQGLARHYFLTGDAFTRETVDCIGDNLARLVEDGVHAFGIDDPHFGRAAGWPLLAMAGAYELDFDERYLKAMRNLVDRALPRQDPNCGGWLYQLYPGHCLCTTRKHVGMAGFITAILINGLSRYGELTGDPRVPEVVRRAVTFLNNDTWIEQRRGWRYTSCPASPFTGQYGVTVMALVNAVSLAGDPEHRRILDLAWQAKFEALRQAPSPGPGQGKTYSATVYGCAETAGLLARTRPGSAAGPTTPIVG